MSKTAQSDADLHPVIADRWSPYVFAQRGVEAEKLTACLEAARWAASSYNEQPWAFIVAAREDEANFQRLLGCLVEANQAWAKDCGVLIATAFATHFTRNGKPNRAALHDLGLAVGNFSAQATHLGLVLHQMAGVDVDAMREKLLIPDTHQPFSAIALGYAADPPTGPLAERDQGPRSRKPLDEFAFQGVWGMARS